MHASVPGWAGVVSAHTREGGHLLAIVVAVVVEHVRNGESAGHDAVKHTHPSVEHKLEHVVPWLRKKCAKVVRLLVTQHVAVPDAVYI